MDRSNPVLISLCSSVVQYWSSTEMHTRVLHWLQQKARNGLCVNSLLILGNYRTRSTLNVAPRPPSLVVPCMSWCGCKLAGADTVHAFIYIRRVGFVKLPFRNFLPGPLRVTQVHKIIYRHVPQGCLWVESCRLWLCAALYILQLPTFDATMTI